MMLVLQRYVLELMVEISKLVLVLPTSITGSSGGQTGAGVIRIAVDFDNKKIWYSDLSGNFFNSGNPATGSNAAFDFSSVAVANGCVPYFFCGTGGK